jgi:6-phosphogluconolactonase
MRRVIDYGERGQVTVVRDQAELAFLAAEELVVAHLRAARRNAHALVALSGGSTPKAMFEVIKDPRFWRRIDWSQVHLLWGDERWVAIEDEQSNAGEAVRGFIDEIRLSDEHYHPWPTHLDDPDAAAAAYETTIGILSGAQGNDTPVLDLVLLGMGDDGHTASLFPGTDAVHEQARLAVAHHVPSLDATRLTLTPRIINAAREIIFLVGGAGKADMLHRVLDGPLDIDAMPSQAIRPDRGRLRWLVDEAAAAQLERE